MTTPTPASLLLFRRDLRLDDHRALNAACSSGRPVVPCFILDPRQLRPHPWQSRPGLRFMIQALTNLHLQLRQYGSGLTIVHDEPGRALEYLMRRHRIVEVFLNRDYTPFARRRDRVFRRVCERLGAGMHAFDDALLHAPGEVLSSDKRPYQVFSAFFRAATRQEVRPAQALPDNPAFVSVSAGAFAKTMAMLDELQAKHADAPLPATAPLAELGSLINYEHHRDVPELDATSHLSAHLKFGTWSVRRARELIMSAFGEDHPLIRQLYWRDFFTHIGWHFPHVFGHAFDRRFDAIPWKRDKDAFDAWCEGRTGFPIVDAGMRELLATGLMNNRLRMITASFLVKDLHLPWRWGEAWFARHLVDYDPAVNNGNWQWAASTGCDAQPWFRIFNPWRQQQRFDPDCIYVKRWLPELRHIDARRIHRWGSDGDKALHPLPIVNHTEAAATAKAMFRAAACKEKAHEYA